MKIPFLDLKAQYISMKNEIEREIFGVIETSAFIGGVYVNQFEHEFATYCNVNHCIGVGNGTDALYLALRCLGVGPGDDVVVPANSFIATSEAVTMTGARVVFADCNPVDYTIDLKAVENALTTRTKAIIPVHLFGQPADMFGLHELAKRHNLFLLEDASQAHGAELGEGRVGTWGDAACFSFYPGKNLGAYGDAGAVVTNDGDLASRVRMTANHGRLEKYNHEYEGVNSRLDGLQAAVLSVKLKHLDEWNEKRRRIAEIYFRRLSGICVPPPMCSDEVKGVYHLFVVRIGNRDEVREALSKQGIATGIHYPTTLPGLKAYEYLGYSPEDTPIASAYAKEILSLPIYPEMKDEQVDEVCDAILSKAIPVNRHSRVES